MKKPKPKSKKKDKGKLRQAMLFYFPENVEQEITEIISRCLYPQGERLPNPGCYRIQKIDGMS